MVAKRYQIELSQESDAFLRSRIEAGEYASADEIVAAALKLMQSRMEESVETREKLQAMVADGLADIEAGRVVEGSVAMAELRQRIDERAASRDANR